MNRQLATTTPLREETHRGRATKAVIFDRHGVLSRFDLQAAAAFFRPLIPLSIEALLEAWLSWQRRHGLPRDLQQERALQTGFWRHLAGQLDLSLDRRRRLERFDYTSVIRPFPEVRTMLAALRRRGLRWHQDSQHLSGADPHEDGSQHDRRADPVRDPQRPGAVVRAPQARAARRFRRQLSDRLLADVHNEFLGRD